jgi:hypothetical protein
MNQIAPDTIAIIMTYLPPKSCFLLFEVLRQDKQRRYNAVLKDNKSLIESSISNYKKHASLKKVLTGQEQFITKLQTIRSLLTNAKKRRKNQGMTRCEYCFESTGSEIPKHWRSAINDETSCKKCCFAMFPDSFIGRSEAVDSYGAQLSDFHGMMWVAIKKEYMHLKEEVIQRVQQRLNGSQDRKARYAMRQANKRRKVTHEPQKSKSIYIYSDNSDYDDSGDSDYEEQ